MTREDEILKAARDYVSNVTLSSPSNVIHFEYGAKWADKNPNSKTIAEYLYKEKGYPISLNGDIPTFEETMKDVQTYYAYKNETKIEKACDQLGTTNTELNLESLWHDASEKPNKNSVILVQWNIKGNSGYEFYYAESINWDRFVEIYGVSIWAYVNDLLPKQFRNPEQLKGGEK